MNSRILNFLFVYFFLFVSSAQSQTITTVSAQTPKKTEISDLLELPASVLANESVEITSVISEKIERILFEEGRFVKKGQLLVELKDDEEQAVLMQINAELDEANLNYERALKLSINGNISQSILDNRLMTKKKLLGKVEEIKARIEDLKIKAPFEGYTGIRNYSEGSFIMPGDIITEVFDIKKLKIQAFIPENYNEQIKVNKSFIAKLDNTTEVKGKISVVNPVIDRNTRTFKILGEIKNIENKIKPGMMVNLKIPLRKKKSLVIRENAISGQDDISHVFVVSKNNIISKKNIEVGITNDGMVEVTSGLSEDDLVVYEGINKIKEGSKVKLK